MPVFSVHALSLILFSDLALATTSTCLIHLMNYFLFLNVEEASGVSTGLSCAGHIQVCFLQCTDSAAVRDAPNAHERKTLYIHPIFTAAVAVGLLILSSQVRI